MSAQIISTLIVDDEPLGRELVRHMLTEHRDFAIVSECADGEKALAAIKRHAPHVVFLDVRMPRLDGMSLLERLPSDERRLVVFVTAHDAYALRAFAAHAFDYLLKPFDQDRFDETITRVRQRIKQLEAASFGQSVRQFLSASNALNAVGGSKLALDRIVVRDGGRVFFVGLQEIVWLEASGNYVALHVTTGKAHLLHETMTAMETKLDPSQFVRIHRSAIVNVGQIKELQPHFNGEYVVQLKDGTRLKLSRSFLPHARATLGLG